MHVRFDDYRRQSIYRAARTGAVPVCVRGPWPIQAQPQLVASFMASKNPPGASRAEREHLLPSEPDKAETYGYEARAVIDHCSIVRPCEQSCPLCEPEKPNSYK
jgi:hypothetical protein